MVTKPGQRSPLKVRFLAESQHEATDIRCFFCAELDELGVKVCTQLPTLTKNALILHGVTTYIIENALFISILLSVRVRAQWVLPS
jgi:hypothetical protein